MVISDDAKIGVIIAVIDRDEKASTEDRQVKVRISGIDGKDLSVNLSTSNVDDLKVLFDATFDHIINSKALVQLELDDGGDDLFNQVASDLIDQLNAEIKDSYDNFEKMWGLVEEKVHPTSGDQE